ncbi:hypothetical protein NE237_010613 [Protea cynaroides]|uniref:E2 ubiquitin-conjugating enzyme n=1 Tax=Protea cynaroides TaxID=273540 RepID=A0A9Q0KZV4_9MAGN|nr:hypothetical protein NE237_010613 [Protea cynaroides]
MCIKIGCEKECRLKGNPAVSLLSLFLFPLGVAYDPYHVFWSEQSLLSVSRSLGCLLVRVLSASFSLMAQSTQASLLLHKQLKNLCKNPVDGFSAGLVDDSNIFEWSVTIIGPPDTLYDGGYFNAIMSFPQNYPNSPPTVRFISEMWHPNVYPDGRVCISILHAPGEDPNGYELASERWTPVHTVESIVLSIISMLSSPNDESPANIEAAKEWRERRDDFKRKVSRIVRRSQEMF